MEQFFRNKLDITFWAAAVALFMVLIIVMSYAVAFLTRTVVGALDTNLIKSNEIATFNLTKAKELHLR